nr:hypothetical protein [Tanacetum cinerariifolium]
MMSPGLYVSLVEVAAMSDLTFRKRFRSSYDSSPSLTLPVKKRYRGMFELILGTDSEEDEEDHTLGLDAMPPTLFVEIDRDVRELYTRSGSVRDRPVHALEAWTGHVDTRMTDTSQEGYDDHRLVHNRVVLGFFMLSGKFSRV